MRLTDYQKESIQKVAAEIFGQSVRVSLYGSRIDDSAKGGDIDLLISADESGMTARNKILFLVELKKRIGDQKIDVVFDKPERKDHFITFIRQHSIPLW